MPGVANLNAAKSVTLDATGSGTLTLGPEDQPGTQIWNIDGLLWSSQASRIGKAPIPRIQIYQDIVGPSNAQAQSYDGSFGSAGGSLALQRGSRLVAVWTGGQAGDVLSLTVTGTKG